MAVQKVGTNIIDSGYTTTITTNPELGGTSHLKVPVGTTAQRPASPAVGMIRYNTTTGYFETYTSSGWGSISTPPTITTISPTTFNGESGTTITINGSFFDTNSSVKFITNSGTEYTAGTVTFINSAQITATTPQDFTVADEPLDVKVTAGSGLSYTLENALDCGGVPTWSTSAGTLTTIYDTATGTHATLSASDPDTSATITYSISSGSLPAGLSLNSSTGVISGDPTDLSQGTTATSSFTALATDNAGNSTSRNFSIIVQSSFLQYQWIKPSNKTTWGTFSSNNQVWASETNPGTSYQGVALNKVFTGDFTVVASWQHDYMGVGMVYKNGATLNDFTGTSNDGEGIYWGELGVSGFPTNASYGFLGQYHAPISGGGGNTAATKHYFKWQRSGNTISIQYSTTSATGPWSNFSTNRTATIGSSDQVIIGIGEASGGENDSLRILSVTGS